MLYLDDLQWGDSASFAIVEALVNSSAINILFLGSYR